MSQYRYLDLVGLQEYHDRLRSKTLTIMGPKNKLVTYHLGDNIDLSKGIYYATTCATATRVSNPITFKMLNGSEVKWRGETEQMLNIVTPDDLVIIRGATDNSAVLKNMNNVAGADGSVALGGSIISSIVGHYKLTGPIRVSDGAYTYTTNLSSESINNIADFLSSTIDAAQQIYHNSDIRLIDFSATRCEFTFSNPVDYIYRNRKYIANQIQDKYIPVGYYYADELVGSTAEASGSTALGSATSKGVLSVAMNNGHSYGCDSVSEGRGGYNTKIGRHFQGEIIDPNTDSEDAYAGSYGVGSHTEGNLTITSPLASYGHAEGHSTAVHAFAGHAEGRQTTAAGTGSHAEGNSPTAFGDGAHAEGFSNIEYGSIVYRRTDSPKKDLVKLWAEGFDDPDDIYDLEPKQFLMAYGDYSHAEGNNTLASGVGSHAQGTGSHASGSNSMAAGKDTLASGANTVAFGETTIAEGQGSITMGRGCSTKSAFTFVGGKNSIIESTSAGSSFVFGENVSASGYQCVAMNKNTNAIGNYSAAFGQGTVTNNTGEFACGNYNVSDSNTLFTIGDGTKNAAKNAVSVKRSGSDIIMTIVEDRVITVKDLDAYAKATDLSAYAKATDLPPISKITGADGYSGIITTTFAGNSAGRNAFAFGEKTSAGGRGSITMGSGTSTVGAYTFVGGKNSKITSTSTGSSFVFGEENAVSGYQSTAFGRYVDVKKNRSFAAGDYLTTNNDYEAAFGRYNKSNSGTTLFSVGNGSSTERKNAFEITKDAGYIHNEKIASISQKNYGYEYKFICTNFGVDGGPDYDRVEATFNGELVFATDYWDFNAEKVPLMGFDVTSYKISENYEDYSDLNVGQTIYVALDENWKDNVCGVTHMYMNPYEDMTPYHGSEYSNVIREYKENPQHGGAPTSKLKIGNVEIKSSNQQLVLSIGNISGQTYGGGGEVDAWNVKAVYTGENVSYMNHLDNEGASLDEPVIDYSKGKAMKFKIFESHHSGGDENPFVEGNYLYVKINSWTSENCTADFNTYLYWENRDDIGFITSISDYAIYKEDNEQINGSGIYIDSNILINDVPVATINDIQTFDHIKEYNDKVSIDIPVYSTRFFENGTSLVNKYAQKSLVNQLSNTVTNLQNTITSLDNTIDILKRRIAALEQYVYEPGYCGEDCCDCDCGEDCECECECCDEPCGEDCCGEDCCGEDCECECECCGEDCPECCYQDWNNDGIECDTEWDGSV